MYVTFEFLTSFNFYSNFNMNARIPHISFEGGDRNWRMTKYLWFIFENINDIILKNLSYLIFIMFHAT